MPNRKFTLCDDLQVEISTTDGIVLVSLLRETEVDNLNVGPTRSRAFIKRRVLKIDAPDGASIRKIQGE